MLSILLAICTTPALPVPSVESQFEQVAPVPTEGKHMRSQGQTRAVLLIHGFLIHLRSSSVPHPRFRDWQRPNSRLVKRLAREADVFAFSYGQNASLDDIVRRSSLRDDVARLRRLGYREIVLIGHSAGGLIARHFVEDNPDAGVTRVIQVCTPNGGTPSARISVHKNQQVFLDCLTEEGRKTCLKARADRRIPASVDFVCVLGHSNEHLDTDGVVPCICQWTPDLRKQCVPVVPLEANHRAAVRSERGAMILARLVSQNQPRWESARVEKTVKELFKK